MRGGVCVRGALRHGRMPCGTLVSLWAPIGHFRVQLYLSLWTALKVTGEKGGPNELRGPPSEPPSNQTGHPKDAPTSPPNWCHLVVTLGVRIWCPRGSRMVPKWVIDSFTHSLIHSLIHTQRPPNELKQNDPKWWPK